MNLFNIEAEQATLGAIILNNQLLGRVSDILEAKHFCEANHQKIYQRILDASKDDQLANQVSLSQFFEVEIEGGKDYLKNLMWEASAIIDIRQYAIQIVELAKKRELFNLFSNLSVRIEKEKIDEVLNELESGIAKIDTSGDSIKLSSTEDMFEDWALNLNKESKPIPTNLPALDEMLNGGLQKGGLYVFAAASGCGKTYFSQNIILNALKCDLGAYFVSMEMDKRKIFARFISILAEINFFRILKNNIFKHELERFDKAVITWRNYKNKFIITDLVKMSAGKIEAALKRALRKQPVDLIVIDYAQIMELREVRNFNEASLIKENVAGLARIAKKYDLAILLLSQLTKDKIDGKVGLGSLKGSGGLYEDADCVIAMWSESEQQKSTIKNLKMEVLKNRDGFSGAFGLEFEGSIGRFKQIEGGF